MTTVHNGTGIAQMQEPFDADETRWLWFSWFAAPLTSEWQLPNGWQLLDQKSGQTTIGDDGKAYRNCEGVLLKTTNQAGNHLITNRCTFENGEELDRSVQVKVRPL